MGEKWGRCSATPHKMITFASEKREVRSMIPASFVLSKSCFEMRKKKKNHVMLSWAVPASVVLGLGWWMLFADFGKGAKDGVVLLSEKADIEEVYAKLGTVARPGHLFMFKVLANLSGYAERVRPGRYQMDGVGTLRLLRNLRNGHQQTIRFTIPVVNRPVDLAKKLGAVFSVPADSFVSAFEDHLVCAATLGTTPELLFSQIIPDTYDFYWNMSPEDFLKRMHREWVDFWNEKRRDQAELLGLSPSEVAILASIVEKETTDKDEKPRIAGLYLNRLRERMRLQADPTVKYAVGDFGLRRILRSHLEVKSPYNTYIREGLPPGPICLPSRESIEAVLHAEEHDYLYMCAKEDFSGSHNFAVTYEEHQRNAARYAKALDERNIR